MSTIKNPVGPEPSKVYWRRRLIVLAGLLAVIAIIVLIIVRPGSSSTVGSSATPPVAATAAPATTAPPAAVGQPQNVEAAPPADGQTAACDAANIQVTAVTDAETYAAGVNPMLSLSLTNTGGAACSMNVGTAQQIYTIRSGDEKYWVSTDCQATPTDVPTVIAAGATLASTPFTWDRTRSAADTCASTDRPQVPAGGASYHLDVSIGGFASAVSKQFILG